VPYSMHKDFVELDHFFYPPVEFESIGDLLGKLPDQIVAPAEEYIKHRKEKLQKIYGS
jgi:hypothetical protein